MTLTAETFTSTDFNQLAINGIRTPSIDAVQPAKSGHPGTPMALPDRVTAVAKELLRKG